MVFRTFPASKKKTLICLGHLIPGPSIFLLFMQLGGKQQNGKNKEKAEQIGK